jgi:hypothetical protein
VRPIPVHSKLGLDLSLDVVSGLPSLDECLTVSLFVIVDHFPYHVFSVIFDGYPSSTSILNIFKESS